jgi:DNA-binding transcriptional regulator GbsR (MarR family)
MSMPLKKNNIPNELEALANQVGSFIEYWGFKKIHGQIWTHIWLAKSPIDATTLVKRLNVSKALVSLAIKDLMLYEVVRVVGQGDRRKILLEANPDIQTVIANVLKNRETKMLESINTQFEKTNALSEQIKNEINLDDGKFQAMQIMIQMAQFALGSLIETHLSTEKK